MRRGQAAALQASEVTAASAAPIASGALQYLPIYRRSSSAVQNVCHRPDHHGASGFVALFRRSWISRVRFVSPGAIFLNCSAFRARTRYPRHRG
jgi:hypothetical protein